MTQLPFYKYQATGNDFILVDNRERLIHHSISMAKRLCDRKFGIGSDGLIILENHPDYDFEMVFYNPDGSKSLCGNGSRCAVNFAKALGMIKSKCLFLAYDGPHEAKILEDGRVRLKMNDVQSVSHLTDGTFIDTGSPHLLVFAEEVANKDVYAEGSTIRYNEHFKANGVNVNFVELKAKDTIYVRTYERGVETETLSCGTGVTASALGAGLEGMKSPISVHTLGGELEVEYKKTNEQQFTDIFLTGPAKEVFSGSIKID